MELNLPPEIESVLREQAAVAGVAAEQFAIARLSDSLAVAAPTSSDVMLPRDQWKLRFDALIESMPDRDSDNRVDCSRDSMYGDRGR